MVDASLWDYKRLGTPENLLVRAGFLVVSDKPDAMALEAGPKLAELFTDKKLPAVNDVAPAMATLVKAYAYEQSGFLSANDMRMQAVGVLRSAGITNAGLQEFNQSIMATAEIARGELAASRIARK